MKRLTAVATGILVALLAAAPVSAGPPSGKIVLLQDPQVAGSTLYVDVSITTSYPVVAYEYAIQNECTWPTRQKSLQRDDIVYWTYEEDGVPHTVMPIYLQSVLEGAKCKVFLAKNNVVVKGSTTSYYTVAAP